MGSCGRQAEGERGPRKPSTPSRGDIRKVDRALFKSYGRVDGARGVGDPLDGLILTMLSQNTSDVNSDRAFARLKGAFPSWRAVLDADEAEVEEAIRPGGISRVKARRIKEVLSIISERLGRLDLGILRGWETEDLRDFFLSLPGVGLKTAYVLLLFYYDRPTFPVDTHVYRLAVRLGWIPEGSGAERAHHVLDRMVPDEAKKTLHLNLISHGRAVCTASKPRCRGCVISGYCARVGVGEGGPTREE
jgi:endonuclease-3